MKFVCPVCGYVYEGDSVPEGFKCPLCGADGSKFIKQDEGMTWASEHVVGVAKDVDPEILQVSETTSRASAARSVCILQWQESLTERVIPR